VRVIYVAGLDLFNRCGGMHSLRKSSLAGVAVVYRPGQNKNLMTSTRAQNDPNVFYISDNEEDVKTSIDISSTLIRKKLKNNEACEHLTYSSVLDYLKMVPLQAVVDYGSESESEVFT
jgi:nicotinic acid mononucleotide adenylyltransferase